MKKKEKKKIFDLYSNNDEVSDLINKMKSNPKVYLKLMSGLQALGCFDGKTIVEIYDCIETEKNKKIKLCCLDLDDNLYVFYALSSDKNDLLKIYKETNENITEYNLALAKKVYITSDNIELTKSDKTFNFKFGRLITDNKNFYSLFMSGDIVYQVSGDFDKDITNDVIRKVNELSVVPTLSEFINIFEMILLENACSFSEIKILIFKEGNNIGNIVVEDKELNKVNLLKRTK